MNKKTLKTILFVTAALNFFYAIAYTMYSTLLPSIMNTYSLSASGMSLLDITENVGSCAAMLVTMMIADRLSKGKALAFGAALYAVTAILMGFAPPFVVFLVLRISLGMFGCFIDTMCTAYVSDAYGENRGSIITIIHTFYSVGCIFAPTGVAYMMKLIPSWQTYYLVDGLFILVTASIFFFVASRMGILGTSGEKKEKRVIPYKKIFSNRLLLAVLLCTLLMSTEIYFRLHLPTFLLAMDPDKYPLTKTTLMVSLFSFGSVFGKLGYAAIANKIKAFQKLWSTCFATGVLYLLGVLVGSIGFWYVIMIVGGFIHGSNFSVKFQMACDAEPEYSATVSSAISFISCTGNIIFSYVAGVVGDAVGYEPLMYICPVALAAAGLLIAVTYRKTGPLLPSFKKKA